MGLGFTWRPAKSRIVCSDWYISFESRRIDRQTRRGAWLPTRGPKGMVTANPNSASAGNSFLPTPGFAALVHYPDSLVHLCMLLAEVYEDCFGVIIVVDVRNRDIFL